MRSHNAESNAAGRAGRGMARAVKGVWRFMAARPRLKMALFTLIGAFMGIYVTAALVALNLDAEMVREKLTQAAARQGMELTAGQLDLSFPFAVTMDNVRLTGKGGGAIELERVRASAAIWKFLFLHPSFHIRAASGAGQLDLDIAPSLFSATVELRAVAENFPLDRAARKVAGDPLPFAAKLDGAAAFIFHPLAPAELEGTIDFRLNALSVKNGGKYAAFLAGLAAKEAHCVIAAGGKHLATKQCGIATSMGDIDLRIGAALKDDIGASPLEGSLVISPLKPLSGALETLYGKHRKPDGKYYFAVRGTLSSPGFDI